MQVERFVATRRERWERLEDLLRRGKKLERLSAPEILQLGELYRAATSDLAIARRDFPQDRVTLYLNGLVARAHPFVYQERGTGLARLGRFVRYGFPAAYRDALPYTALTFGVFLLSALAAAALVTWRASLADVLLPGQAEQLRQIMAQHHLWMQSATSNHSVAANFIMLNNIQVAILAFAGGMLAGALTLLVMMQNGISIGAIAALVAQYHLSEGLWSFVAPHGVIELSVIFMAGGAGMMIGDAILRPGLLRRRDAITQAAHHALTLLLGGACLLVVAGTIEGFFSPSGAPDALKYAVGAGAGILLYSYLLGSRPKVREVTYTFEDVSVYYRDRPAAPTSVVSR